MTKTFNAKSARLMTPGNLRAGDTFLTPDSKWHRADEDAVLDERGERAIIVGVSAISSERLVLPANSLVELTV